MPARPGGHGDRSRWRGWLARHSETLQAAYLVAVGLILVSFAVGPVRTRMLSAVESGVYAWDARWTPMVEHGEDLVSAGRYEEAIEHLTLLDRRFPARDVRHARDRERERILRALGRAYAALDREGAALSVLERAVEFDPLHYRNRLALARTADRFGEADIAQEQYRQILAFRPSHLPSVRAVVAHAYDEGDYEGVVRVYEEYLGAFVAHHLVVRAGPMRESVPVPVDGNSRPITIRFDEALGATTGVRFEPGPYGFEIENVALRQGLVVGAADRALETVRLDGTWASSSVQPDLESGASPLPVGETVGSPDGDRVVAVSLPPTPANVVWLQADVRLLKPMDLGTWKLAEASYRNVLDFEGLETARRRTFLSGGTTAVGTNATVGLHR